MDETSVRIDKWLWAVRIYKTRSVAADACKAGHVLIDGQRVKPARTIKPNDVISAKVGVMTKTVKVIGIIDRRVGAKIVKSYLEDQTPESEYAKLADKSREPAAFQTKGFGRPTKKDRRTMERFLGLSSETIENTIQSENL
jgi:ribosome-associated heat shock protein Hsp15